MPSREEDGAGREKHKNEMERFADYRNYLDFNMYEQSIDENGIEKKNYVDDMAGVDSGGEGQNPKYVALLAGAKRSLLKIRKRIGTSVDCLRAG